MTDCESVIRPAIASAFSEATLISEDNGDCRITVPFERSDGDLITLWVVQQGDSYIITDEGETHGMLYLSNINLDQESRSRRVQTVREQFDLDTVEDEVRITVSEDELGRRVIDAIQAVQALSYLTYTRRQYTQTDFRADVGDYLLSSDIKYDNNPSIPGATEDHRVDFSIRGQSQPTYLEALHAEDASTAKSMAWRTMHKWVDIRERDSEMFTISVVDDESGEYGHDTERILRNYSDQLVPWSQRDELLETLRV